MGFTSKDQKILTYYNTQGKKGDYIIFIHGFLTNTKIWEPSIKLLSKKFKCVYYDLRGHGNTGKTSKKEYDFDLFTRDLNDLMEYLEIDSAHICGFGIGSMIAQHFAEKYPKKTKKLILVDAFYDTKMYLHQRLLLITFLSRFIRRVLIFALGPMGVINLLKGVIPVFEGSKWLYSTENLSGNKLGHSSYKHEFIKLTDAIAGYKTANLYSIKVPTMIINGEFNESLSRQAKILKIGIQDCKLVWVPSKGHCLPLENPEGFVKQLVEFVKE